MDQRVLIVTTRWSKDDLVGKMIRDHNFSENWKHIVFPLIALGIAEQGPYEYREPGEILWPEEYTEEQIIEAKRDSYIFACMYQQDPIIRSGGI